MISLPASAATTGGGVRHASPMRCLEASRLCCKYCGFNVNKKWMRDEVRAVPNATN